MGTRTLWAVSDLHVTSPGNRELVDRHVHGDSPDDWLLVAGDVAEKTSDVIDVLGQLAQRFDQVIWVPGNHELYSAAGDALHGREKYAELVQQCRLIGVLTPEDDFPEFAGHTIVPMFTLYDHSWRELGSTPAEAIAAAERSGIVLTDHFAIAPFVDIPQWCRERLLYTVRRLAKVNGPTVLVNHWPLVREAMNNVTHQEIGLWSGTRHTQGWPERYGASAVIYGHLHIPIELFVDNVTHAEVSLGYPREWKKSLPPRLSAGRWPYRVLTEEVKA